MTEMTRRDRTDLMALAKLRTKIAKDAVTARENELLAEVEEQLSAIYDEKDTAWQELADQAAAKVEEFNEQIAKVCDERGIPRRFRPMLMTSWYGRGENGIKERRAELRKLAEARIKAAGSRAKTTVDVRGAEVLTELVAVTLDTEEAQRFLDKIPNPAELMPPVAVAELEAQLPQR
jgi:polyhydroxyalkanoate synthesis regulator phasin